MNETSNSPESQPNSTYRLPEQAPRPKAPEEEPAKKRHEEEQQGAERQAERQPERTTLDQQVKMPQVATDDDSSVDDSTDDAVVRQPASSMPDVAEDVDVIEKAWVDKAKQVIKDTKDDPHAQEQEFEKLQIEYHKKRYGRDIKATR